MSNVGRKMTVKLEIKDDKLSSWIWECLKQDTTHLFGVKLWAVTDEDLFREVDSLKSVNESLRAKLDEMQTRLDEKDKQITDLKNLLYANRKAVSELSDREAMLVAKKSNLESDLAYRNRVIDELNKKIEDIRRTGNAYYHGPKTEAENIDKKFVFKVKDKCEFNTDRPNVHGSNFKLKAYDDQGNEVKEIKVDDLRSITPAEMNEYITLRKLCLVYRYLHKMDGSDLAEMAFNNLMAFIDKMER